MSGPQEEDEMSSVEEYEISLGEECEMSSGEEDEISWGEEDEMSWGEEIEYEFKDDDQNTPPSRSVPRKPTKSSSGGRQSVYSVSPIAQAVAIPRGRSVPLSHTYKESLQLSYMEQCFDDITFLGEGSFGVVYKALSKDDGKYYAVKKCKEKFKSAFNRESTLSEVVRFGGLPRCQYCVEFFRAWEEDAYLFIQMELCSVNLRQYSIENRNISEEKQWNILLDLLLGVKHLHTNGCIHLDIKPDNVLISQDDVCKLGDFGLMLDLSKGKVLDADEGDARYLAPEVLQGVYTKAADIFSIGITMLDVVSNIKLPPAGPLWHKLRKGKLPRRRFLSSSDEFFQCIKLMMSGKVSRRPSVEKLLSSSRLRGLYRKRYFQGMFCNMAARVKRWYSYGKMVATNYRLIMMRPFQRLAFSVPKEIEENDSYIRQGPFRECTPPPTRHSPLPLTPLVGPSTTRDFNREGTPKCSSLHKHRKRLFCGSNSSDSSSEESPESAKRRRRIFE